MEPAFLNRKGFLEYLVDELPEAALWSCPTAVAWAVLATVLWTTELHSVIRIVGYALLILFAPVAIAGAFLFLAALPFLIAKALMWRRAGALMSRIGSLTYTEQQFLYPEACGKCGCRVWEEVDRGPDWSLSAEFPPSYTERVCQRCLRGPDCNPPVERTTTRIAVSPFLRRDD